MTVDLARIKKVQDDLEAVVRAEAAILKLGPSFPAFVLLERVPPRRGKKVHSFRKLWLRRHEMSWRLLVESGPEDLSRSPAFSLLEHASRRVRLLALKALPELERALFPSSARTPSASSASATPRRS
jgi:hypothetical protein